jgi:hypothetical protein
LLPRSLLNRLLRMGFFFSSSSEPVLSTFPPLVFGNGSLGVVVELGDLGVVELLGEVTMGSSCTFSSVGNLLFLLRGEVMERLGEPGEACDDGVEGYEV